MNFLNLYLSGEGLLSMPRLLLLSNPPAPHAYSYTFRHFGDASCSCSIPQVITEQPGWSCWGLAAVPGWWLLLSDRRASVFYDTHEEFFQQARRFEPAKPSVTSALLRPSRERRVLRVHLTCHEFGVKIWTNGIWQEWLLRTGSPLLMSCL